MQEFPLPDAGRKKNAFKEGRAAPPERCGTRKYAPGDGDGSRSRGKFFSGFDRVCN